MKRLLLLLAGLMILGGCEGSGIPHPDRPDRPDRPSRPQSPYRPAGPDRPWRGNPWGF